MGSENGCEKSTITIKSSNFEKAMNLIKENRRGFNFDSHVLDRALEADNFIKMLEILSISCEVTESGITSVQYRSGRNDPSDILFNILAPIIEDGGVLVMLSEFSGYRYRFENGKCREERLREGLYVNYEANSTKLMKQVFSSLKNELIDETIIKKLADKQKGLKMIGPNDLTLTQTVVTNGNNPFWRENLTCLLTNGADLQETSAEGKNTLWYALDAHEDIFQFCLENGATTYSGDLDDPFRAILDYTTFKIAVFEKLITAGISLEKSNILLRLIARRYNTEERLSFVKKLIIEYKIDVNYRASQYIYSGFGEIKKGSTPLMIATLVGDFDMVKLLISMGAKVDLKDSYGLTALHYGCGQTWVEDQDMLWGEKESSSEIRDFLVQHGASYKEKNCVGDTPYDIIETQKRIQSKYD